MSVPSDPLTCAVFVLPRTLTPGEPGPASSGPSSRVPPGSQLVRTGAPGVGQAGRRGSRENRRASEQEGLEGSGGPRGRRAGGASSLVFVPKTQNPLLTRKREENPDRGALVLSRPDPELFETVVPRGPRGVTTQRSSVPGQQGDSRGGRGGSG